MTKIEELEQKVKELSEEIEQLKKQEKVVCSRFIPKADEKFWVINMWGGVDWFVYHEEDEDIKFLLGNFPVFRTEGEAKRYSEFKQELTKRRWLVTEEEWGNSNTPKYLINIYDNEFNITCTYSTRYMGIPFFSTKGAAQFMIDNYEDILGMELI